MQLRRIAGAPEPVLIEDRAVLLAVSEVAGRDHGALEPHLIAVPVRHELEREPRHRQTDADLLGREVDRHAARSGLGRTVAGREEDPFSHGIDGELLETVVERLRQTGAAIERELQIAEEPSAQLFVFVEGVGEHRITEGHIDIELRRDFFEIAERLREHAR